MAGAADVKVSTVSALNNVGGCTGSSASDSHEGFRGPPREPPTTPKVVTIDLEKPPAGLVVQLDGQPASVPVTVPFGDATHELRLEAPGFKGEVLRVDGRRDKTIVLNMQPMPNPPAKAKQREPHTRKRNEGFNDL